MATAPLTPDAAWRPRVSIVMLTFNQIAFTQQCLMALAENTPGELYELIVVDNASADGTPELLAELGGDVRVVLNEVNKGFVDGCNQGAALAQGDYILLLNNDTLPQPGWLEALLDLADADPTVGVVGSKLIYPDGRLQEAGCVIWADGQASNLGRGHRPDDPRWNFVRDVDYCSGASLMIRREAWERVGGFDEHFRPAYSEDSDLCFAIRAAGYRIVYQPASEVLHYDGATNGQDRTSFVKRYLPVNREKFREKWAHEMAGRPLPPEDREARDLLARRRSLIDREKTILVVDPVLPMYDRASGCHKMWEWIKVLRAAGHHVVYVARDGRGAERYADELRALGVEVYATDPERLAALGHPVPDAAPVDLSRICAELRVDVVWLSFWEIGAQYGPELRALCPAATFVIDSHDAHFLREERRAQLEGTAEAWERARVLKERELAVYRACDRVIAVTEEDRRALAAELPDTEIVLIPNVHPLVAEAPGHDDRDGLLFVGNFNHPPNLDGIAWFCREVLPLVRTHAPEITLTIAGNGADLAAAHLAGDGVTVLGWVPDVRPHLDHARLSVAPLRYGAGLKGKVGEALAAGIPVITTPAGAEGFPVRDGMLVAEDAADFALAVLDLYNDRAHWQELAGGARRSVAHLTPEAVAPAVLAALANDDMPARAHHPLVSIVILTWNELPYTKLCVESVLRHTRAPYELIFVDNGSTDGTPEWLRTVPGTHVIANPVNHGFAGGCNQGMAAARGDYVLLLNNDIVVADGWLDRLLAHAEADPSRGIVGPVASYATGVQMLPTDYGDDLTAMETFAERWYAEHAGRGGQVTRLIGFLMLIRREVVTAIGALDEGFGRGNFEDDDYCIRAAGAGYTLWLAEDVFVHHFGSRTFIGNGVDYTALIGQNWEIFKRKWELPESMELVRGYDPFVLAERAADVSRYHIPLDGAGERPSPPSPLSHEGRGGVHGEQASTRSRVVSV